MDGTHSFSFDRKPKQIPDVSKWGKNNRFHFIWTELYFKNCIPDPIRSQSTNAFKSITDGTYESIYMNYIINLYELHIQHFPWGKFQTFWGSWNELSLLSIGIKYQFHTKSLLFIPQFPQKFCPKRPFLVINCNIHEIEFCHLPEWPPHGTSCKAGGFISRRKNQIPWGQGGKDPFRNLGGGIFLGARELTQPPPSIKNPPIRAEYSTWVKQTETTNGLDSKLSGGC